LLLVVPARQAGNRFLCSLKDLQIRAQGSVSQKSCRKIYGINGERKVDPIANSFFLALRIFLLFKKVMNPVVLSMAFSFGVVAIDVVKMAFEMGEPAL
jgi:hypothetical protein